ncbi:hypothetical protein Hanom_Chr13g01238571 [Helianthus anomalus]
MPGKFDHSWLTTVLFISSEITFEILILFLSGVVSERLDREPTAADVSIAAADMVFFFLPEEASAPVHGSSVTPTTLRTSVRSRNLRK